MKKKEYGGNICFDCGQRKKKPAPRNRLKKYNVFYTPTPVEHEVVVEARSKADAVRKVKKLLHVTFMDETASVKSGWEIK